MTAALYALLAALPKGTSSVATAVATIIGIAGVAGGALAWLRVNLAQQTIEIQKSTIDALNDRTDELEQADRRKSEKLLAQDRELAMLRNMVTGVSVVQELNETIRHMHRETLAQIAETHEAVMDKLEALSR